MVRAILAGTKTQTRRIIQPAGIVKVHEGIAYTDRWDEEEGHGWRRDVRCPYGVPGDHLWVKEAWTINNCGGRVSLQESAWPDGWPVSSVRYCATDLPFSEDPRTYWWNRRPSIFMPRWASRILLEVTEVRVQRLQDITEEDAKAEGFGKLWREINGAGCWETNPWVWAVSFRRLKP